MISMRSYLNVTSSQMAAQLSRQSAAAVSQRSWVRIPFRPEFFSGLNFTTAQVVCVTAMINHKIISFSAVEIYLSYIHLRSSLSTGISRTHKVTSSQMAGQLSQQNTAPLSQRSWVRILFRPEYFSGSFITGATIDYIVITCSQ